MSTFLHVFDDFDLGFTCEAVCVLPANPTGVKGCGQRERTQRRTRRGRRARTSRMGAGRCLQPSCTGDGVSLRREKETMRVLTVILSLYFLCLGAMPCLCADMHKHGASCWDAVEERGDGGHGETGRDLCAPFCTAHCCHHSPVVSARCEDADAEHRTYGEGRTRIPIHDVAPYKGEPLDSIWHPPIGH